MTTVELSKKLAALERDVRQAWVQLLDVDAVAADQLGDAGRLIHRATAVLDDKTMIY